MVAKHLERTVCIDSVSGHQDPLRLLDRRAAPERTLQAVVLREPLKRDVDRARQLLRRAVDDVREDAALRRLVYVGGVISREQRDNRARRLVHDRRNQIERVVGM